MHGQRQIVSDQILIDWHQPGIEQRHAIVDRAELHPAKPQILDRMDQQIHAVRHAGIKAGKPDELFRVHGDQPRGHFVIAINADGITIAQRKDDGVIDRRHRLDDRGRIGFDRKTTGARHTGDLAINRQDLGIFIHVHVAIHDHGGLPYARCDLF